MKVRSLDSIDAWWFECLCEGRIIGTTSPPGWPTGYVPKSQIFSAYSNRHQGPKRKRVADCSFWSDLYGLVRFVEGHRVRFTPRIDGHQTPCVVFPTLAEARDQWRALNNGDCDWDFE
eukprot:m.205448 g.205448  ORF g.205448 m.205448 type:complete len:118 (+) comp15411_c1_seq2:537-890(+)